MIRVLHITTNMNRGGLETFIMNVYRNIDRSKIQFDFLIHTTEECDYNEEIKKLGGRIFSVPSRKKGFLKNRKALDDFFKEHSEYSIVHQHLSSLSYIEPLRYAWKNDIPLRILHSHSTKQSGSRLNYFFHKWNSLFVELYSTNRLSCSHAAAKWLYTKSIYKNKKYQVINNGIDLSGFSYDENLRTVKRQELGIENSFVVGHVGRFSHPKNHMFLMKIFNIIQSREPSAILLLVGDGELKSIIEKKAHDLGLRDKIMFMGVRDDISDLLQTMDVFVFPSIYEGLPVSLIEAQATGLPCVISDAITEEVMITDHIKKLSLNIDAEQWGDMALEYKDIVERKEYNKELNQAGFNISTTVKVLEDLYMKKL